MNEASYERKDRDYLTHQKSQKGKHARIYIYYIQPILKVDPLLSSSIKEMRDERICVCVCV